MIPKDTPLGTAFWTWDLGRLWHAPLAMVSDKNVAFVRTIYHANREEQTEIILVDQSKVFLRQLEAAADLADKAFEKAKESQSHAVHWMKELERLKREENK